MFSLSDLSPIPVPERHADCLAMRCPRTQYARGLPRVLPRPQAARSCRQVHESRLCVPRPANLSSPRATYLNVHAGNDAASLHAEGHVPLSPASDVPRLPLYQVVCRDMPACQRGSARPMAPKPSLPPPWLRLVATCVCKQELQGFRVGARRTGPTRCVVDCRGRRCILHSTSLRGMSLLYIPRNTHQRVTHVRLFATVYSGEFRSSIHG